MLKKLLLTTLLTLTANAQSCWSTLELARYAQDELDGKATLSIKDAVSCKAVPNAEFYLGKMKFKANAKGLVHLPTPPEDMDRLLPITMKADGYITAHEKVMVTFGSYWTKQFLLSKKLPPQSARFVLSWGDKPSDLDIHLVAKSYHISYRNTKNIPSKARLDRDATNGYGAETITVDALDSKDEYKVLVYNYSNNAHIDNKGQVRVYANNELDGTVTLPRTSDRCLEVASIKDNVITYETKVSNLCKKR